MHVLRIAPSRSFLLIATLAALLTALLAPAGAAAHASISRSGNHLTISADAGIDRIFADNTIASRSRVRFRNLSGRLTPGRGCTRVIGTTWVDCGVIATSTMNMLWLTVNLGGGNDTFAGHTGSDRQPRVVVNGGAGDDHILGTDQRDELNGDAGNDSLQGLDDTDDLDGGEGDDRLLGENGNDALDGGAGTDRLFGDVDGTSASIWGADVIVSALDFGIDTIDCGGGNAGAVVDADDVITASTCEALSGGQTTPPLEHPEGTLPLTISIGAPQGVSLGRLVNGSILHFPATFSAPAFISGKLTVSAAEARRVGLGTTGMVLADDAGIPLTVIPITVNAQMRLRWPVRSSLAALRTRPGFTSLHATLELRGTDVNQAGSVSRRVITLTR
jgi:hypothetical protein